MDSFQLNQISDEIAGDEQSQFSICLPVSPSSLQLSQPQTTVKQELDMETEAMCVHEYVQFLEDKLDDCSPCRGSPEIKAGNCFVKEAESDTKGTAVLTPGDTAEHAKNTKTEKNTGMIVPCKSLHTAEKGDSNTASDPTSTMFQSDQSSLDCNGHTDDCQCHLNTQTAANMLSSGNDQQYSFPHDYSVKSPVKQREKVSVVATTSMNTFEGHAAIHSDKTKPLSKRRRHNLKPSDTEGHGLQFLNSYCLALELSTDEKSVKFCQKMGLLPQSVKCPSCSQTLERVYQVKKKGKKQQSRFQCHKRSCKESGKNIVSVRDRSWFQNSNMSIRKNLLIMKCFVDGVGFATAVKESSVPEENAHGVTCTAITSLSTITDLYSACREICALSMLTMTSNTVIGGRGKTVELGESMFDHLRKIDATQDRWLLAGICQETDKVFLDLVPSEDHEAAVATVVKHVKKGTHIITQCFPLVKCSDKLIQLGFMLSTDVAEDTENAFPEIHDAESKLWLCVRRHFPSVRIVGGLFALYLAELIWRWEHSQDRDPFHSFISEVSQIYQF